MDKHADGFQVYNNDNNQVHGGAIIDGDLDDG